MFVHRSVFKVGIGNFVEAAALLKDLYERFAPPHPVRILTSWLYPNNELVVELEFASLGEYEEYWRGFHANQAAAAWRSETRERRHELFEGPGIQEMWQVR